MIEEAAGVKAERAVSAQSAGYCRLLGGHTRPLCTAVNNISLISVLQGLICSQAQVFVQYESRSTSAAPFQQAA